MLADGNHAVPHGKMAVIVTYLEMLARPEIRNVPPPSGVTLRRVTPDLVWYRDIFTRVGALDWLWSARLKMTDGELQGILDDPDVHIYTLTSDGQDEALLELDFRQSGECELAYFGLTPKLIGTGAGRYLMDRAIDAAWQTDVSRFHVHTCTADSPQALDFYTRSGFTAYKRAVEIEEDPRLTGILPESSAAWLPII